MMFMLEMLAKDSNDAQNSEMIKRYLDMFEYVAGHPGADRIIRGLLGPGGALERHNMLATRHGAELFLALSRADPGGALAFLERFVDSKSRNETRTK